MQVKGDLEKKRRASKKMERSWLNNNDYNAHAYCNIPPLGGGLDNRSPTLSYAGLDDLLAFS